jgi:hypothetical protein
LTHSGCPEMARAEESGREGAGDSEPWESLSALLGCHASFTWINCRV